MITSFIVLLFILGSVGLSLVFISWLFVLIIALGRGHIGFGILIFFVFPAAIVYCWKDKSATRHWAIMMSLGYLLIFVTACLYIGVRVALN